MTPKTYQHQHRVTYTECTVGNHVYYARYLDILEAARGEFFRAIGFPLADLQEREVIFPAIECHLRYLAPARYDDELVIDLSITRLQRIRLEFEYKIALKEKELVRATTVHACTTTHEKPSPIPEDLQQSLKEYLQQGKPLPHLPTPAAST